VLVLCFASITGRQWFSRVMWAIIRLLSSIIPVSTELCIQEIGEIGQISKNFLPMTKMIAGHSCCCVERVLCVKSCLFKCYWLLTALRCCFRWTRKTMQAFIRSWFEAISHAPKVDTLQHMNRLILCVTLVVFMTMSSLWFSCGYVAICLQCCCRCS